MEVTQKIQPRKIAPNTPITGDAIESGGGGSGITTINFVQTPTTSNIRPGGQPVILKSPSGKQVVAYPVQSGGGGSGVGLTPLNTGNFAPQIIQSGDQKFLLTHTPLGPKLIPITPINSNSQPQQQHQSNFTPNAKLSTQYLSSTAITPTGSFVFPSDSILAPNPTPTTPLNFSKHSFTSPLLNHPARKRVEFPSELSFDGSNKRSKRGGGGDGKGGTGKGLRHFSLKVCEKVRAKGITSYNEVADELVNEFASESGALTPIEAQFDQKNIRRRVYDALNVLMAMEIISKEKKEIKWLGLPTNSMQESSTLQKQHQDQVTRMKSKTEHLHDLIVQLVAFKSLVQRNKETEAKSGPPPPNGSIHLPFLITSTAKNTVIDCSISNDKMEYLFNFNGTFEIHDDIEVLKRMGLSLGLDKGECTGEDLEKSKLLLPRELGNYVDQIAKRADDWSKGFNLDKRELDSLYSNTEDQELFGGFSNGGSGAHYPMDIEIQAAIDALENEDCDRDEDLDLNSYHDGEPEDSHDGFNDDDSNDV